MKFYKNDLFSIQLEQNNIPWVKIFINRKVKEFSSCTIQERTAIFTAIDTVEKAMLSFYKPQNICKINIASFGNYLPQVHWHIMARFENDEFFPESVWGKKQRESSLDLPPIDNFIEYLLSELS
jgi:diadenosine tetraphosphate (Ap4A) HIT family hydrolase